MIPGRHGFNNPLCLQVKSCFTVMWVRDPVARFVSTWLFHCSDNGKNLTKLLHVCPDLNEEISRIRNTADPMRNATATFTDMHELQGISFYTYGSKGLESLLRYKGLGTTKGRSPKHSRIFVGRDVMMYDDLAALHQRLVGVGLVRSGASVKVYQTQHMPRIGKRLTRASILFLRDIFSQDLACIKLFVANGLLPIAYFTNITSESTYLY